MGWYYTPKTKLFALLVIVIIVSILVMDLGGFSIPLHRASVGFVVFLVAFVLYILLTKLWQRANPKGKRTDTRF